MEFLKIKNILFTIILLIIINFTSQSQDFKIHYIPDSSLNATAAFVFLEDEDNSDYLYFSFDLNFYNEKSANKTNVVYFDVSTKMDLSNSDFQHTFLDKEWYDVTSEDIIGKNLSWRNSFLIARKNSNYYVEVNKFGGKNKVSTLILRIPLLKKEGYMTVANLNSFPSYINNNKN